MYQKSPKIYKLNGTGNDFLVVNCLDPKLKSEFDSYFNNKPRPEAAIELCNRTFNVGADGLIFLEPSSTCDIKWDFYNSDGSSAEMCGNAARCIGLFCLEQNIFDKEFSLESLYGPINILAKNKDEIKVSLQKATLTDSDSIDFEIKSYDYDFINSGVPHVVIESATTLPQDLFNLGQFINQHERFKPAATNVSFYKVISEGHLEGISYERGVNDFTLACGTGAIAMAFSYQHKTGNKNPIKIKLPGGVVTVEFSEENSILIGPANFICELELVKN